MLMQILDLLTLPELMQSLPKEMIQPRTYFIKPSMSFFIGGLARIDFENGPHPIRYTLFSNSSLPVTMSLIQDADMIYEKVLKYKLHVIRINDNIDNIISFVCVTLGLGNKCICRAFGWSRKTISISRVGK